MLNKWLREPLVHFLLIGGALFLLYGLQNEGFVEQSNRIVISEAELDRLITLWGKKRQRPPTQFELEGLIEQQIREEVLYREARAMGLDQNDSIVRRRLAQKVEFIFADLVSQAEPTDTDLADYLATHADLFEVPGRISFVQVYLSTDKRGARVEEDASRLLADLLKASPDADIMMAGDRFMFGQQYKQQTEHDVSRLFGKDFANKLFNLPVGHWQGPVLSGYGLHLVRIDNKTDARQPELDAVRDKVHNEWLARQRRVADEAFYQSLRQRYEIIIENVKTKNAIASVEK